LLPRRVASALRMIDAGELAPDGLLVLRDRTGILGAGVVTVVPGGSGIVWPPRALDGSRREAWEDLLALHQLDWLRQRGALLAQSLLPPNEVALAAPLLRAGYQHITSL